jgi:hypothetical protein
VAGDPREWRQETSVARNFFYKHAAKERESGDKEIGEETTVQIARELLRRELKDRGGLPLSEASGGREASSDFLIGREGGILSPGLHFSAETGTGPVDLRSMLSRDNSYRANIPIVDGIDGRKQ